MKLIYRFKDNNAFVYFFLLGLVFLCWGGLLSLHGIWWDDWAWVWQFYSTENFSQYIKPFISLRKVFEGTVLYLLFSLFSVFKEYTTLVWNILKFIVLFFNAVIIYGIAKRILGNKSLLPVLIASFFVVSPVVNNICLVTFLYQIETLTFLLSLHFCSKALLENENRKINYTLSIILAFFTMFAHGGFILFDGVRALIIFYIFYNKRNLDFIKASKKTLIFWLPFLIIGVVVVIDSFLRPQNGAYAGEYKIPALSINQYGHLLYNNYWESLNYVYPFYSFFAAKLMVISKFSKEILMSLIVSIYLGFSIFKLSRNKRYVLKIKENIWVFIFGLITIVLGILPYALVRGAPSFGMDSRHALLLNLGVIVVAPATICLVYSVIYYCFKHIVVPIIFTFTLSLIMFLNIFLCMDITRAYRNDWDQQLDFWHKFVEAVPDLKTDTFLVVHMPRNEERYFGVWRGAYSFAAPLNFLYATSSKYTEFNRHFAISSEDSYFLKKGDGRKEVSFESFKGLQNYYPQNFVFAKYEKGVLQINKGIESVAEVNELGITPSNEQIIYRKNKFPMRWFLSLDLE